MAKDVKFCKDCNRALTKDEVGLTRKLVERDSKVFYCLDCLAARYKVDTDWLRDKIEDFKYQGCTLFQ